MSPPNRATRRAQGAAVRAGAELQPEAMDATLGALAQTVKGGLPLGWDVTLVVTRHAGDGRATLNIASTLPPAVRDGVLVGLGDSLRVEYGGESSDVAAENRDGNELLPDA